MPTCSVKADGLEELSVLLRVSSAQKRPTRESA